MIAWLAAAGLALLPVLTGSTVAERLAGARWASAHPRAALLFWQAMGLAGGLGAVGVGLVAAVAPLAVVFPHGMHVLGGQILQERDLGGLAAGQVIALTWSITLVAWLIVHTLGVTAKVAVRQRRLRLMVDVVADHLPEHDAYVLPSPRPVAYCVPGRRARVVLSQGTLHVLDERQLKAVVEHERAHAAGRHDLLLLPFLACARAFPWLPWARLAHQAVGRLLEMLADDRARRRHGEAALAQALVTMADPATGEGGAHALALTDVGVVERLERLVAPDTRGRRWAPVLACLASALVLSGPLAVLAAPLLCLAIWGI
ncbi:M56 family metallopeptidase [Sphaerimonospora mesophila]|uniref:M56 family metallopeptidase n=1 Tax=Sphaerimonospora mesophila TaxID=37483 RepID=UPI0006E3A512